MEKYFEVEDLTPQEALEKLHDEGSLVDAVQNQLEDPASLPPALQYDSSEDPEMNEAATLAESFAGAVHGLKLNENVINGFNLRKAIADFIKDKHGRVTEDDFDEFYDLCKDGYDNWEDPRNKEGVRRTFEKNLEKMGLSGFDDSEPEPEPEPFDISKTSKRTQDLVALYADYAETTASVKETVDAKYDAIYDVVANIIEGTSFKKHAFICGDAGVGKTYSVKKCVKELWDGSPLKAQGWKYKYQKGSIGTSIAPVTAWLYENRDRKICVLDDADAFLAAKDPDVMNMFKGVLNTENTLQNPEPVTTKATIRKTAAGYISDKAAFIPTQQEIDLGIADVDAMRECEKAGLFEINKEKFNEGILEVAIEGEVVCSQRMSESQRNSLRLVKEDEYRKHLEERAHNSRVNGVFGLTLREGDLLDDYNAEQELIGAGGEGALIPEAFCFTSRVIVISNIAPSRVDDAFRSRCDVVPVTLTHDEFIAHCADVIPGMMLDLETSLPQELIISIRDLMYGYATLIIEMKGQKIGPNWPVIKVNLPLQFRLFAEMAGKWLAIAKAYCRRNKMELTSKTFPIVQKAIEARFLMTFIIPMFADNVYEGGHDLKRRR